MLAASQAKWRQINKFLEIVAGLLRSAHLPPDAHIADMGCGKGYLTFALYDYLTTDLEGPAELVWRSYNSLSRKEQDSLAPLVETLREAADARADFTFTER